MTIENAVSKTKNALKSPGALQYNTCCVPYAIDCLLPEDLELDPKWYEIAQSNNPNKRVPGGVKLSDVLDELRIAGLTIQGYGFEIRPGITRAQQVSEMAELIKRELRGATYGVLLKETYQDQYTGNINGHVHSVAGNVNALGEVYHYDTAHFGRRESKQLIELVRRIREHNGFGGDQVYAIRRRTS